MISDRKIDFRVFTKTFMKLLAILQSNKVNDFYDLSNSNYYFSFYKKIRDRSIKQKHGRKNKFNWKKNQH